MGGRVSKWSEHPLMVPLCYNMVDPETWLNMIKAPIFEHAQAQTIFGVLRLWVISSPNLKPNPQNPKA